MVNVPSGSLQRSDPVQFGAERLRPIVWIRNQVGIVSATGFKYQRSGPRICSKPACHNRARCACSTHDVIERGSIALEIQRNWRNFQTALASRFGVIFALRLRAWRMNRCISDDRSEGSDCRYRGNKLLFLQNRFSFSVKSFLLLCIDMARSVKKSAHTNGGPSSSIPYSFMSCSVRTRSGAGSPLFNKESFSKKPLKPPGVTITSIRAVLG
jgi:hypothetical protein